MTWEPGVAPPRVCATTGLRLVASHGQTGYRCAKGSYGAMNPPPRELDPSSVQVWGRWDVPGARTIYVAQSRAASLTEVLNYLAPSAGLRDTKMSEVFGNTVADANITVLQAIAKEWDEEWHITPKKIVKGWRDSRLLYPIYLPPSGWFIDIESNESIAALNRNLASALSLLGIRRLTRAHLCGERRELTVLVADWVHSVVLDDGTLPHGIEYRSKHGLDQLCWAIWLRRMDDGYDASFEPTASGDGDPLNRDDPDLLAAAGNLDLEIW